MLALPPKGFARSILKHNVDAAICCDWIEACAMFGEGEVTGSDIVDVLRENEIYADQGFAWQLVNDVFITIRERKRILGAGYPLRIQSGTRVVCDDTWHDVAPYAFCLALSLSKAYPAWSQAFGQDFGPQGKLFEDLTAEAVAATFSGWEVHQTGWAATEPNLIANIVRNVAELIGEATGEIKRWSAKNAKEAGLDLLCFRPFSDGRAGFPIMLFQCASGKDWRSKLHQPELRVWTKIVSFTIDPQKALAMPFALDPDDFRYHANVVNGLLLDRDRLLAPGQGNRDWISADLRDRMRAWVELRIGTLPFAA
ncbi:hypothetical protein DevBK_19605 [Devosia sp. BK]|uniref:hypothetical protein n=1 Tax=Devosia sp. BK TaxID=2871706 RepID=UPI0029399CE5|nr:hypothetical protein [Devosia sp. BK]MDV3253551.1 hypothetical protein [Devosia sp. BK]